MNLLVAGLIVLGAAVVAGLALASVHHVAKKSLLADSGRGRPMIQVTGTMFAVVLAFVILAAFQTYDGARGGAQSEAAAVLDDTGSGPTPLWLALVFAGCVAIALQLSMADPREQVGIQSVLVAGFASVVVAGLLIVNFLDHPYHRHTGGIQPTAMRQTLVMVRTMEPGLRVGCSPSGEPV